MTDKRMTEKALPPKARTPLWHHVTEGAKAGELRLQICLRCGQAQYPPREVCGRCLSDDLEWKAMDGAAKVLGKTRLHASLEPWFQDRLPVDVALVQLDIGPIVYAFAGKGAEIGVRVTVEARIDEAGQAVLWAKAE